MKSKKLTENFSKLNSIWEKLQFQGDCTVDNDVKDYPFKNSFDEVFSKVISWRDSVEEVINVKYQE